MQTIVVNRSGDVADGDFRTNDKAVTLREAISIAAESGQKTLITLTRIIGRHGFAVAFAKD